jgi:hypothetical protein
MTKEELEVKMEESRQKIAAAREEVKEHSKMFFAQASKDLFAFYPELRSFGWNQYTPYWNDGDECVFGANTDYPIVNDWDFTMGEAVDGEDASVTEPDKALEKAVSGFLGKFDDDMLKEMFGDHVAVMVDAQGVTTEEYEHE